MVLYQKYRPKKFAQLVNQNPVKETLLAALKNDRVAHAYLFAGPRGTGKTTVARILARALNCQNLKDGEPCGRCPSCQESEQNSAVDVVETDAASNRGIGDIRKLRERIKFSPIKTRHKVYIIDEVHMLTLPAFNALLKILEEPPSYTVFILATTEPHKVPETVLSRCQCFNFRPLSISEIAKYLGSVAKKEKYQINDRALLMIGAAAQGSLRDGLGILEQVAAIASDKIAESDIQRVLGLVEKRAIIKLVDFLASRQAKESLAIVDSLIKKGIRPERIIDTLNEYLRQLLLIKFGLQEGIQLIKEEQRKALGQAKTLTDKQISQWIEILLEAKKESSINLPQLPLEMAIIKLIGGPPSRAKTEPKVSKIEDSSSWSQVLTKVKKYNHSLSAILSACRLTGAKGGRLILKTDRTFYQRRIMDPANRRKIEEAISESFGRRYQLDCRLQKDINFGNNRSKSVLKSLSEKAEQIFNSK